MEGIVFLSQHQNVDNFVDVRHMLLEVAKFLKSSYHFFVLFDLVGKVVIDRTELRVEEVETFVF